MDKFMSNIRWIIGYTGELETMARTKHEFLDNIVSEAIKMKEVAIDWTWEEMIRIPQLHNTVRVQKEKILNNCLTKEENINETIRKGLDKYFKIIAGDDRQRHTMM